MTCGAEHEVYMCVCIKQQIFFFVLFCYLVEKKQVQHGIFVVFAVPCTKSKYCNIYMYMVLYLYIMKNIIMREHWANIFYYEFNAIMTQARCYVMGVIFCS